MVLVPDHGDQGRAGANSPWRPQRPSITSSLLAGQEGNALPQVGLGVTVSVSEPCPPVTLGYSTLSLRKAKAVAVAVALRAEGDRRA
jgi:hypothetical protein